MKNYHHQTTNKPGPLYYYFYLQLLLLLLLFDNSNNMNRAFLLAVGIALLSIYYARRKAQANKRLRQVPARGERVVIVGCSSGIGRELALCYAARGAKLALFARRTELMNSLKQDCEAAGSPIAVAVAGDVTRTEDLERLVDDTRRTLGGVDTLIYCAGTISVRLFLDASGIQVERQQTTFKVITQRPEGAGAVLDQALDKINNVNYTAAVRCVRLFLPLLLETSKAPNIVAISSLAGKVGAPTRSLYAGSKHALHGFLDSLRVELQPLGVHIGVICPGTVETNLRSSAVDYNLGTGEDVAGSKKGKLKPRQVALATINASDRREREVYIPAWMGYSAIWGKMLASSWVDWVAARKYKLP